MALGGCGGCLGALENAAQVRRRNAKHSGTTEPRHLATTGSKTPRVQTTAETARPRPARRFSCVLKLRAPLGGAVLNTSAPSRPAATTKFWPESLVLTAGGIFPSFHPPGTRPSLEVRDHPAWGIEGRREVTAQGGSTNKCSGTTKEATTMVDCLSWGRTHSPTPPLLDSSSPVTPPRSPTSPPCWSRTPNGKAVAHQLG